MIQIQRLKEPKKTSGEKLEPGKTTKFHGVSIKNLNKFDVYLAWKERKPYTPSKKELSKKATKEKAK